MAASKPELVEELLREAELVVREAPPAVRSDMAQVTSQRDGDFCKPPNLLPKVGAPVGPQEGGIYSTIASLGTRHSLPPPPFTQSYPQA